MIFLWILIGFLGGVVTGIVMMCFMAVAHTNEEQIRKYQEKHKNDKVVLYERPLYISKRCRTRKGVLFTPSLSI